MPWNWKAILRTEKEPDAERERVIKNWLKLLKAESQRSDADAGVVASHLETIGSLLERRGMCRVGAGDPQGWNDLHTGWRYRAWDTQVSVAQKPYRWTGIVPEATMLTAAALAFAETRYARWCAKVLFRRYDEETVVLDPAHVFLIRLYARWLGREEEFGDWDDYMRPYAKVFHAWKQPKALARAIAAICDYHCANGKPMGPGVFWKHPHTLIPFEVAALVRVREVLGLTTPRVDHPLLATPLAQIPRPMPKLPPDPLLENVVAACRKRTPRLAGIRKLYWRK